MCWADSSVYFFVEVNESAQTRCPLNKVKDSILA